MIKLKNILNEIVSNSLMISPFEFDQDGNAQRIKRDINNGEGWRRLGNDKQQNQTIKRYLDKHTSGYKWKSSVPTSDQWQDENKKMYETPYIMYVHLLQTSEGKNNVIEALQGMLKNEPIESNKLQEQTLLLIYENKEQEFNNVYSQYLEVIEKNAIPDDGSNVFAAVKYAKDNFSDKVGIFKKFVRNGWGAVKFNLS
tara:strand:+ start:98 stop:691 length:594 start_codon:yes stop_codon:yes gene_type:complete